MYSPFMCVIFFTSKNAGECETSSRRNCSIERRARHDLLVTARTPAEQREVVDEGLGQVALVAVGLDGDGVLALGELLALLVDEHRQVRVLRVRHEGDALAVIERLPHHHLLGRRRQQVLAADDVRDRHAAVVDRVGERIEHDAVGAHDDEVLVAVVGEGRRHRE